MENFIPPWEGVIIFVSCQVTGFYNRRCCPFMTGEPSLLCSDKLVPSLRWSHSKCSMKIFFLFCLLFFFFSFLLVVLVRWLVNGLVGFFCCQTKNQLAKLAKNFSSFLPQLPFQENSVCTSCSQTVALGQHTADRGYVDSSRNCTVLFWKPYPD